ncbi:MAG: tetratricopeptide repeat protein [Candidatus Omnitrophica bacterium]|nr:tetratricopeptide repeat protein [Candidatus Omnitrophota bacterium]
MRIIALTFLVLLLTSGTSFTAEKGFSSEDAVNYYNEGVKAQQSGDYNTAFNAYQKTLLLAPDNLEYQKCIRNNLGIMYFQRQEYEAAEQFFKEALIIDPDCGFAKLNLGLVYDVRKSKDESLQYWAQLLNLEAMKPKSFIIAPQHKNE